MKLLGIITFSFLNILLIAHQSLACSACNWGEPKDQSNIALRAGVLLMLGVLLAVLFGFAKFFINLRRKARLM